MKSFSSLVRVVFCLTVLPGLLLFPAPTRVDLHQTFLPTFASMEHPLGTDRLGRDIYALYCYGILGTIFTAIPARILTLAFSTVLSLFSYIALPSWQYILRTIASVFLSLPSLLVALVIVGSLGTSFWVVLVAIVVSDWALAYESIQTKVRDIQSAGYVIAASSMGAGKVHIFKNHIFSQLRSIQYVLFITGIPAVIMTIAIFSFLGIDFSGELWGPGLGEQISFAKDFYSKSPMSVLVPAIGIFLLVYSFGKGK
ncbi:MAG: ABC transporter permease subunit [Spirochaetota bacterium]